MPHVNLIPSHKVCPTNALALAMPLYFQENEDCILGYYIILSVNNKCTILATYLFYVQ